MQVCTCWPLQASPKLLPSGWPFAFHGIIASRMLLTLTHTCCVAGGLNFANTFSFNPAAAQSPAAGGTLGGATPGFNSLSPAANFGTLGAGLNVGTGRATTTTRKAGAKHKK